MRIASTQSDHWTDDRLIDRLYGLAEADDHFERCGFCRARAGALERRRRDSLTDSTTDIFLAAQRRAIYARLAEPSHWWSDMPLRRLGAVAAMTVVLAGTATFYEKRQRELAELRMDAQLAQDVSQMSFESEPQATAPLEGLFVE